MSGASGIRIIDMPDLGAVSDASSFVAEKAGSGRMAATALTAYHASRLAPIATGATTPRTLPDRFADMINVKDFGAKGDGATNDTAAIVAAVTALASGGSLYFPRGNYRMTPSVFTGLQNLRLYGAGTYASQITFTSSGIGWTFSNCQCLEIEYLSFRTSTTGISAVCFRDGSGVCTVDTCQFVGFDTDGLQLTGVVGNQMSGHKVLNCLFLQCNNKQLNAVYSNDFWIEGNQFGITSGTPNPAYGAFLDTCSAGTYMRNYHWGNGIGLWLTGCNYCRIEANRIEESQNEGAHLSNGSYNIFSGNTVHTNNEAAGAGVPNAAFTSQGSLTVLGNQSLDWATTPRAANDWGFGAGCNNITLKANRGADHLSASVFLDPSLAANIFNGDRTLSVASKATLGGSSTFDFMGPSGMAGGTGFNAVAVPIGTQTCAVQIRAQCSVAPGAGHTFVYTLVVNGSAASLNCTIADTNFAAAGANGSVNLIATDNVCVQITSSTGTTAAYHRAVVVMVDY